MRESKQGTGRRLLLTFDTNWTPSSEARRDCAAKPNAANVSSDPVTKSAVPMQKSNGLYIFAGLVSSSSSPLPRPDGRAFVMLESLALPLESFPYPWRPRLWILFPVKGRGSWRIMLSATTSCQKKLDLDLTDVPRFNNILPARHRTTPTHQSEPPPGKEPSARCKKCFNLFSQSLASLPTSSLAWSSSAEKRMRI